MNEVVLIVDQYKLRERAVQEGRAQNPSHASEVMSQMANAFGRDPERLAIVNNQDKEGLAAFSQHNYKLELMNGNRVNEITQFISKKKEELENSLPRHLIVVTDDPTFQFLLDAIQKKGKTLLSVWVPGQEIPSPYNQEKYNTRLLREVLPDLKLSRVDIRLDFENLHHGLKERGWKPNAKTLVEAIKKAVGDLGEITRIVAYGDWGVIQREDRQDWQRALAEHGVESRYLINERGKNTADMKIADAIRDIVERSSGAPDAAEVVVVATNDRDFKSVLETARQRGQRVVLLGIRDGLSRHLRSVVKEGDIRYIDDFLNLNKPSIYEASQQDSCKPHPADEHAELLIRIAAWVNKKEDQEQRYTSLEQFKTGIALNELEVEDLIDAIKQNLLLRQRKRSIQGTEEFIALNLHHPLAEAAEYLTKWGPRRVRYCLEKKGMPYVDSNFLAKGMELDRTLRRLQVGQNRYEAEGWLELLESAGILVSERRKHHRAGNKAVITWRLPPSEENSEGLGQPSAEIGPEDKTELQVTPELPTGKSEVSAPRKPSTPGPYRPPGSGQWPSVAL